MGDDVTILESDAMAATSAAFTAFEQISAEPLGSLDSAATSIIEDDKIVDLSRARIDFLIKELSSGSELVTESVILAYVHEIARAAHRQLTVANLVQAQRDNAADNILYALQLWLDKTPSSHPQRRTALYLIVKLANKSHKLPRQLFLDGVTVGRAPRFMGGSGMLYFGQYQEQSVVVKRLALTGENTEAKIKLLRREVLVWRQLKHPRILKLIGVEKAGGPQSLSIVSVRLESESLQSFVEYRRRHNALPIGHTECVGLMKDIIEGLSYLHENKVVHGDIKPPNILVDHVGDQIHAVLCDFGISLVGDVSDLRFTTHHVIRGTTGWTDVVAPNQADDRSWLRWQPSRDIYAFGLVCLWLCIGKLPHDVEWASVEDLEEGVAPPMPTHEECTVSKLPRTMWRMMLACWLGSPDQRPTAAQLYDFFVTYDSSDDAPDSICKGTMLKEVISLVGDCVIQQGVEVEIMDFLPNKHWCIQVKGQDTLHEVGARDVSIGVGTARALQDSGSKLSPDRLVYHKGGLLMLLAPVKHLPTRWLAMDGHDNVGSVELSHFQQVTTDDEVGLGSKLWSLVFGN